MLFRSCVQHGLSSISLPFVLGLHLLVCPAHAALVETPMSLLNDMGVSGPQPQRVAGYFQLNSTHAGQMWYMFFESRRMLAEDPVILWIHGGPGCSSALAVFYEHGPFRIDTSLNLKPANYSWEVNHNMIYIDQPMNTGFSFSTDDRDIVYTEAMLAEDVVAFLQEFFAEHSDMQDRDFYIGGVSYAGHMVPNIATALYNAIRNNRMGFNMRFQGIALGNPWIDPEVQYASYAEYGLMHGLIDDALADVLKNQGYPACQAVIKRCNQLRSYSYCSAQVNTCSDNTVGLVTRANPGINVYDIRKPCVGSLCYDFSLLTRWINQDAVRRALGARRRRWDGPCSATAHSALMGDWLYSYDQLLAPLLEAGIRVVIYAGDMDLLCCWPGQRDWLEGMVWSGQSAFKASKAQDWIVDGAVAGNIRTAGPLSFVVVHGAGHEVPMDTPKQAWHLYSRFTRNLTLLDDSDRDAYWDEDLQAALSPPWQTVQGSVALKETAAPSQITLASIRNGTAPAPGPGGVSALSASTWGRK